VLLFDGGTVLSQLATVGSPSAAVMYAPPHGRFRFTPSAAAHTYSARAFQAGGNGLIGAGNGAAGAYVPGFLRIIRA
jgi:hypothetical protein